MPTVHYGTKDEPGFELEQSDDLIAVRTRSGRSITRAAGGVATPVSEVLDDAQLVVSYRDAGVEVYRVPIGRGRRSTTERKQALRASPDVRFAGGVLVDPGTSQPVLYTENLFVKFKDTVDPEDCEAVLREAGLAVKQRVDYATNGYFVGAPEGIGQEVFEIANALLKRADVEFAHPELIRPRVRKGIFPQQWHLRRATVAGVTVDAHANVEAAHAVTRGEGITIAIIDDGVDIDHPEFAGATKIVAPRDIALNSDNPRPKDPFGTGREDGENHGTACAGVACANGTHGASGVAPGARLMPIRLSAGLGSQSEATAFKWAADRGADVISCSWGPPDGRWWKADDPLHGKVVALPASTRLAIDHAATQGRGGKGCVILFAAGNGNEPVENDGYASYAQVIAVAACNDRGSRSVYSDFGKAVWCAFPSNDFGHPPFNSPEPLTPGIWTTDRTASAGYNTGSVSFGDTGGLYANDFGGTSSACPGAAGVVALVLSVNPNLKPHEVREVLKQACDRIDPQGGGYSAAGHSPKYGHGRLNAATAVALAKPQAQSSLTVSRTFDAPVPDLQTVSFTLDVVEAAPVAALSIAIDLRHSYIGDLIVTLVPPAGSGVGSTVLHNRAGGSARDLRRTYDVASTPQLGRFAGRSCKGRWTLTIRDAAAQDSGTLASVTLNLSFARPDRSPAVAPAPVAARKPPRRRRAPAPARRAAARRGRRAA